MMSAERKSEIVKEVAEKNGLEVMTLAMVKPDAKPLNVAHFAIQPDDLTATTDVYGGTIEVGCKVRSFGDPMIMDNGEILGMGVTPEEAEGDRLNYVEGIVEAIGEDNVDGCARYRIKITKEVYWHHTTGYKTECYGVGHMVYPPLNGTRRLFGGNCFGVVRIEDKAESVPLSIAIMFDPENKKYPFAIRIERSMHHIDFINLEAKSLPGAVREADAIGYKADRWINNRGIVSAIPSGIVRR